MGKRSNFERMPRDLYDTPIEAIAPLIPYLHGVKTFVEPCAGRGKLMSHLQKHHMVCIAAYDIDPQNITVAKRDTARQKFWVGSADAIITNPPWTRSILHPMIENFQSIIPTWLLFDSDWAFTKQSRQYLDQCSHIVSVGRLKWIPDSPHTGKDNCAWYRFHDQHTGGPKLINTELEAA